jgi:hypothetical protein
MTDIDLDKSGSEAADVVSHLDRFGVVRKGS